jgi:hypothetical protein
MLAMSCRSSRGVTLPHPLPGAGANEVPILSAWVTSGKFSSTFFPLLDVDTFNQQPQGE